MLFTQTPYKGEIIMERKIEEFHTLNTRIANIITKNDLYIDEKTYQEYVRRCDRKVTTLEELLTPEVKKLFNLVREYAYVKLLDIDDIVELDVARLKVERQIKYLLLEL